MNHDFLLVDYFFLHTCDRAQQKQKSDILVYSNIFKLEINLDHMYYYSMGSIDFGDTQY
jgi:hypothetical protein